MITTVQVTKDSPQEDIDFFVEAIEALDADQSKYFTGLLSGMQDDIGDDPEDPRIMNALYSPDNWQTYIIRTADEESAGIISLYIDKDEKRIHLKDVFIYPKFQGKGIGKEAMEYLLFKAKSVGAKSIVVGYMTGNKAAVSLYKKFKFTPFMESAVRKV